MLGCVCIGMSINNWPLLPYVEIQFQLQVIVKVISSSSYFYFFFYFSYSLNVVVCVYKCWYEYTHAYHRFVIYCWMPA